MTMETAVHAEHLWCAHHAKSVLRDLNFTIHRGEIAVIVGVNGVGKSTLLATIAGAISAVRGNVSIFGHVRRAAPESERSARRMAVYLPDEAWLPGFMQVREYLGAAAALFEVPPADAIDQIDALLDVFALTTVESQSLGSLSAGQKKKVGLCAGLLANRPLLLLDEPFSGGLDPAGIAALRRVLIDRARTHHQTIVLTTPVAEVICELADRLLILRDGELVHNLNRTELQHHLAIGPSSADALNSLIFPDAELRIQRYLDNPASRSVASQGEN